MIKVKKILKAVDYLSESGNELSLVLFNDDFNTFDFVVKTLIDVCEHTEEQALQCTLIAELRGKCVVKKGTKEDLKQKCSIMIQKGLTVEICSKD